jgi:hypothetical protein
MGRPRHYTTPAARQAAYRQRLHAAAVLVDRTRVEQLDTRMAHLQDVLVPVARAGNPLAQRLIRTNLVTLLDVLTEWFLTHQPVPSPPLPRASRLDLPPSPPSPSGEQDQR